MTILDHHAPTPTPGAARSRSWLFFRAITTCVAVLILGQAALAGGFLSGHYDALAAHGLNGGLLALALLAQCITAVVWWRSSRGPSWPVRTSLIQLLIAGALIPLGEQRVLTVHVPLAVGLTVGVALLLVKSWGAAPTRPPRTATGTPTRRTPDLTTEESA
ncbi:hypothetical protein ABZ793_14350 [Micromonospora sp. NPDC047465]|uniref:hypothetical protein n=1 Tax=Micromonospora sp. NPDC047465 TaxID=3154813 RepID=UPI0033E0FE67